MKTIIKFLLLLVVVLVSLPAKAQPRRISGTVSDDIDVIIGANVVEKDKNQRIVSQAITDMNGNFSMNIKDPRNTLEISYIGYKKFSQQIGTKNVFKVTLLDNTKTIKEVVVTGKKSAPTTGLDIPAREFAGAVQNFKMDDLDGLAFESVDQALQGQIAGLDIVGNSGNLGSGTTMRLRGTSTINGNAQPLIVLNDHIFELPEDFQNTDFSNMDNEEQFSTILNVNPEDIESITVLKDAATAAKWGQRGANGVIEIKTRRGKRGKTRVNFTYKLKGTWQPDGYSMLDGDGYTMMLKEGYFNPNQKATTIPELDYNMELPYIYNHYSKNTDWFKEVTQFGQEHKFTVVLSGGGEKASFRVSANYDKSTGSIIGQKLDRFTTSTALDYEVSERIKFQSNLNMSFMTNHKNYVNNLLDNAYAAMPNMSVMEYDNQGNLTGNYFNMLPLAATYSTADPPSRKENDGRMTSYDLRDMFANGNPVALADKAWHNKKQYNLTPQFNVVYKLLGIDNDKTRLDYWGDVQLNIYNTSDDYYMPSELRPMPWVGGGENSYKLYDKDNGNNRNYVSNDEHKSFEFTTRHDLRFYSAFPNRDHALSAMARFEMASGNSNSQNISLWNVPDGITDPTVVALVREASSGNGQWRSQAFFGQLHYTYKSKYSVDASVRVDGSTSFGRGQKYGNFPSIGARWNIIDEKFMDWSRKWLSMLAIRPTWGLTGNPGGAGSNQYNKYMTSGYYNGHQVIMPENLSLNSLRWEEKTALNLGFNIGLFDDLITAEVEYYDNRSRDLMMDNLRIPSANGFSNLAKVNAGEMRNRGWELNMSTARICKVGKFSMRLRGNIAQNINMVEEMNPLILETLNGSDTYQPGNLAYNQRVQVGNALGSIYGLHYLGVYKYDMDHCGTTSSSFAAYGFAEVDKDGNRVKNVDDARINGTGYDAYGNKINTAAAAERRGDIATCPIARDANGEMLTDAKGNPLPMYYCYNEGSRYQFQGGDAIYEDINHDGQIDRYDMVYLGNSNPTCSGGFGLNLYYGRISLNAGFNFRLGNQIVNMARMKLESMLNNQNQSFATTWRWRKNGDETVVPRALNSTNGYRSYNSLPSDRYIENGDYLRLQYIQLGYDFDAKKLKKYGINQLKLYASMDNVFCWSKYTGTDPEVSIGGFAVATDSNKTPRAKSFTCSLTLGF